MIKFDYHVDSIAVSADGTVIAAGLSQLEGNIWDGCIKLISVETGVELQTARLPCGTACVAFTSAVDGDAMDDNSGVPNGILVGRDDGVLGLYSGRSLQELDRFDFHDDCISAVRPQGTETKKFYSCGWDGNIAMWDWGSESRHSPVVVHRGAHYGHINDIATIAPSHSTDAVLASVGDDGFLRLWDSRAAHTSGSICSTLVGVGIQTSCIHWDGNVSPYRILVGTDAGTVCGYDLRHFNGSRSVAENTFVSNSSRQNKSFQHDKRVRRITSCGASTVFTVSDDASVGVCRVDVDEVTGIATSLTQIDRLYPHSDFITDICSQQGGAGDGSITLFTASTDKSICMTSYTLPAM